MGYRTMIARYVAIWGISHRCACEMLSAKRGIAPFWGSANLPKTVSRDMGYRSDSIAMSHDMALLRPQFCEDPQAHWAFLGMICVEGCLRSHCGLSGRDGQVS